MAFVRNNNKIEADFDDVHEPLKIEAKCPHLMVCSSICVECGKPPNVEAKSSWNSSSTTISVSLDKAQTRLNLVLDLDETLLHSKISVNRYEFPEDHPLFAFVFELGFKHYFVYLRPGLKKFLHTLSQIFDIYIYTNGTRAYAENIFSRLLTPSERAQYIKGVFARVNETAPTVKSLERGNLDKRFSVIIDDRADVWPQDQYNLLQIVPFQLNPHLPFDYVEPEHYDNVLDSFSTLLREIFNLWVSEPSDNDGQAAADVRDFLMLCNSNSDSEEQEEDKDEENEHMQ